jgi:hypothetical protein
MPTNEQVDVYERLLNLIMRFFSFIVTAVGAIVLLSYWAYLLAHGESKAAECVSGVAGSSFFVWFGWLVHKLHSQSSRQAASLPVSGTQLGPTTETVRLSAESKDEDV